MQKISSVRDVMGLALECKRTALGMRLEISGIVKVREYSSERITLVTHGGTVSVEGERLSMSGYVNQSVELYGRVKNIEFSYGKK